MKNILFISIITAIMLFFSISSASAEKKNYQNTIGMEFVLIPAGSFIMGAHEFENGNDNEKPRHKVNITTPFYLGIFEVTQNQWLKVMGKNPSTFQSRTRPVENISWDDAQQFIKVLNQMEDTNKYRLPTEAEWEYAARAGSETAYHYGNDPNAKQLPQYAWYAETSGGTTQSVGKLKPNAWGLYDMHGNVWEWCQDWYHAEYYKDTPSATDPEGPSSGTYRVFRGGSWISFPEFCRSAYRNRLAPEYRISYFGFRLAFSPDEQ